jgi:hypothetical protein
LIQEHRVKQPVLLVSLLLSAAPERVSGLLETMRLSSDAGDRASAGRIIPILMGELAKPHPKAGLAWNRIAVFEAMQGNFAEAERAYRRGIKVREHTGASAIPNGARYRRQSVKRN